jgi:uncharacterized OB-fold protein
MSETQTSQRPIPVPSELTEGFWEAAKEERLAVQQCRSCGTYFHPPVSVCQHCQSADLGFSDVSGRGKVVSMTLVRSSRIESMAGQAIIVLGVELEEQEGLVLIGNLLGADAEEARVGLPVTVAFEDIGEGYKLPQFTPAGEE